jgi:cell division septal protein FtsQ
MSKDTFTVPETRSWRDIPQQVKPRAMSREGRRRLVMGTMRAVIGVLVIGVVGWGAWDVSAELRDDSSIASDSAKSERVRNLVLVTDGVLDRNWLVKTLGIPTNASLMGLDLVQLRSKVLADSQVVSASVTRDFPGTVTVRVSERSPVVRLMDQSADGSQHALLVSRDGVAFDGKGFDPAMIASLPWIDGVSLVRHGASIAPIGGMPAVSDLLASAKLEAESLYRTWEVVSIGRLATDGEIEIHSKGGMKVIFGTNENFLRQIARLDLLIDSSSDPTRPLRQVDLSLGSQVPVAYGTASPTLSDPLTSTAGAPAKRPLIAFPGFSNITN